MSWEEDERSRRNLAQMRRERERRQQKAVSDAPRQIATLVEQVHNLSVENADLKERVATMEGKLDWLLRYTSGNLDG
jgi:hypothetical protein